MVALGTCGGNDCSNRPGGFNGCCMSAIQDMPLCTITLAAPCRLLADPDDIAKNKNLLDNAEPDFEEIEVCALDDVDDLITIIGCG
jgi:hypothetical protein